MKYLRYAAVLLLVAAMMGTAALLGEREIIFPEILALAVGAWGAEKQPWRVSRLQMFCLMTAGAFFGVLLVRYAPIPLFFQIIIAFAFAAAALVLSGTTIVPMISACVLPVLLQTQSWVYPLSVIVLIGAIALGQTLLERPGLRERESEPKLQKVDAQTVRREALHWAKLLAVILALGLFATSTGYLFLIAPPLLVTYAELSHAQGKPRKRPGAVLLLIVVAAWSGAFLRLFVCEQWGCPLWLTAVIAAAFLLVCFEAVHMIFPPAGAVILLPMLLDAQAVVQFPLLVSIGGALLVAAALIQFPKKAERVEPACPVPLEQELL